MILYTPSCRTQPPLVRMVPNKNQRAKFHLNYRLVIMTRVAVQNWCALYRILQSVLLDITLWRCRFILPVIVTCVLDPFHGALDQLDALLTRCQSSANVSVMHVHGCVTLTVSYTGCHLRCHNDHALSQTETLMPCVGGEYI